MITFEMATEKDVFEIDRVMQEVDEKQEDTSLFVADDLAFIKRHIEAEGFVILAKNEKGKIVGFLIVRYPRKHRDNLGYDISLSKEELQQVVHMESVAILPEYRGMGLQSKMLLEAEKNIKNGNPIYFMATVSPENIASCKSFEKNGYKNILTKEKYGGLLRRIYHKD